MEWTFWAKQMPTQLVWFSPHKHKSKEGELLHYTQQYSIIRFYCVTKAWVGVLLYQL